MPSLWKSTKTTKTSNVKTLPVREWNLPRTQPKLAQISALHSYVHQVLDTRFPSARIAEEILDLLILDTVYTITDLCGVWACLATGSRKFSLWEEAVARRHLCAPMRFLLNSAHATESVALDLAVYVATVLAKVGAAKREITVLIGLLGTHRIRTLDALVAMFTRKGTDAATDILESVWFQQCLAAGVAPIALELWTAVERGVHLPGAGKSTPKASWVTVRKLQESLNGGVMVHNINGWA
ncbi:hypothetical protein HDU86_002659 [Geranomyces michiganensis]|nr:hypothetical protein HDU86_002659 [Geranomyces michiganensis]